MGQLPLFCVLNGDKTGNIGMGPEWELNSRPFGVRNNAPSNRVTWPGQGNFLFCFVLIVQRLLMFPV